MKKLFAIFTLAICLPVSGLSAQSIKELLQEFDNVFDSRETYLCSKGERISRLQQQRAIARNEDEIYALNSSLYKEYYVFNSDSAYFYAQQNYVLGQDDSFKNVESRMALAFILAVSGVPEDALRLIEDIRPEALPLQQRINYYDVEAYTYSQINELFRGSIQLQKYDGRLEQARRNLVACGKLDKSKYYWHRTFLEIADGKTGIPLLNEMIEELHHMQPNTREYSLLSGSIARIYHYQKDSDNYLRYLIYTVISDMRTCNRITGALSTLILYLSDQGDVEHANKYIKVLLDDIQLYKHRVKMLRLAEIQNIIYASFENKKLQQKKEFHAYLFIICILIFILIIVIFYIMKQMKRLSYSKNKLNEINEKLNKQIEIASGAHLELQEINQKLAEKNEELNESNYIKEKYIGYIFNMCSSYINKLDEFRKNINRKINAGQWNEVRALVKSTSIKEEQIKYFYQTFDTIFLQICPDYVKEFNELLRPENQIQVKEGELLTPELRIYALVRLGINDSVKIAEFLHYSPQTVYNYRLKTRNKSDIPKGSFAKKVRYLGNKKC